MLHIQHYLLYCPMQNIVALLYMMAFLGLRTDSVGIHLLIKLPASGVFSFSLEFKKANSSSGVPLRKVILAAHEILATYTNSKA